MKPYVTVIGAANIDINAKSKGRLIPRDSNPGAVTMSSGGVGRNVAENLARLGVPVKLVAALGDDFFGRKLLEDCRQIGIDAGHCQIHLRGATPVYVAILDDSGDMNVAVIDNAARLSLEYIRELSPVIGSSSIILLDTNLHEEVLLGLPDVFGGKEIYADTISVTKAGRIKDIAGRFHTLKMNRMEASFLAGCGIDDEASLEKAAGYFLVQGTERVVISLGSEGVYYRTKDEMARYRPVPIVPVNATGAGDALMAGIIHCSLHNKSPDYTVRFSHAMAHMALMSESAVNPHLSLAAVEELMEV